MNQRRFNTGYEQIVFRFPYLWIIIKFPENHPPSWFYVNAVGFVSSMYEVWDEKKKSQLLHHVFPYALSQKRTVIKRFPYQEQLRACGLLTNQTK